MTAKSWEPLVYEDKSGGYYYAFEGTLYGNDHTIRIKIDKAEYEFQGLFFAISEKGKVQDLRVDGTIACQAKHVGGICGENDGTISSCTVSANVSSTSRLVGGITGQNTGDGTITNCWVSADVRRRRPHADGQHQQHGTTLTLTFSDPVSKLKAGTPYIIKFTKDANYVNTDEYNIVNPIFEDVTIDATDRSYDNEAEGDAQVRFIGTYDAKTFGAEDKSILFMGGSNTLYYPQKDATIGACRGYFKIGEDGSAGDHARITAFNLNFGDDGSTIDPAGIHAIDAGESAPQGWYDMQGRKLIGKPSRADVYIYNGVKRVIK
ncbi:MAG: hypothetical protein IJP74_07640 [Prevotella sp.]|nr:hypothetical protein [Prevotella sp.]